MPEQRFVIISGCSGGGKSTLIAALAQRGHAVVEEPGRRIVAAEADRSSPRLPWNDPLGFATAAIALAEADLRAARAITGPVFFDRGLIDAHLGRWRSGGPPPGPFDDHPFHPTVFLAPPWPEIYVQDAERRHGLEAAMAEFDHLAEHYPNLGYATLLLPKAPVRARVEFVLRRMSSESRPGAAAPGR